VCRDPEEGLHFFGPTEAEPDVPWQVWSQGETTSTRHWIPVPDHPNERLTSELHVTVDEGLQVLSNGALAREGNTWSWTQGKDHVPYLITLVVGQFAVKRDEWRGRPVEYWVPPRREPDAMRSFGNTVRMLDYFSERIGVEYPWEKYAQVVVEQFGWGGMENTSATTLNERTLHDEKAARDYTSDGLVAHELAHQWFGNLLTCRDWAHTWLNEGFATYFDALWVEHDRGTDEFAQDMMDNAHGAIEAGRKLPIVHRAYAHPWDQFDGRAYPKGAWVLHMIRRRLGDELWWKCVNHYVRKHAHTCVETFDLRRAIEETTGRSFERFFHDWTERAGHPVLEATHEWHADDKLAEVRLVQKQAEEAFHFPLRIDYRVGDKTVSVTHDVAAKETRFFVPLGDRPAAVEIDPQNAVLMELTEHKGRDLWLRQLQEGSNPVARARAASHLGASRRDEDRDALGEALAKEPFWGVQAAIAKALGASGGDKSRDVLLNALAIEHPKARRAVVEALGKFRDDATVTSALEGIVRNGDESYYVEAEAIRSWAAQRPEGAVERLAPLLARESHNEVIREAALDGIAEQADPKATPLLIEWTRRGKPRPCRTAALRALAKLAKSGEWKDEDTKAAVSAVSVCLHRLEGRHVKTAAAQALRDIGQLGAAAVPALEALAQHDPSPDVRREAEAAIEKIRSGTAAPLELQRLRDEIAKLREEDRKLRERLEKLDAKQ
jgi:aminopeptidase N